MNTERPLEWTELVDDEGYEDLPGVAPGPGRGHAPRVRVRRTGTIDGAPWMARLGSEVARLRRLDDERNRARTRRNLAVFLAFERKGASLRWLAKRLGVSHVMALNMVNAGREIAADLGGDLVELERAMLGWEGEE